MKKCILVLLISGLTTLSVGCSNAEFEFPKGTQGQELSILRSINVGPSGLFEAKGIHLIRSVEEYQLLCEGQNMEAGTTDLATVNFATESVVIAARGMCDTEGYWIAIRGLALDGDNLQVFSESGSPKGEMAYMAITHPRHAVVVPKLAESVNATAIELE